MQLVILSITIGAQPLSFVEKQASLEVFAIGVLMYHLTMEPENSEEESRIAFFEDLGGMLYSEPDTSEPSPCSISRKSVNEASIEEQNEYEGAILPPSPETTESDNVLGGLTFIIRTHDEENEGSDKGDSDTDEEDSDTDEEDSDDDGYDSNCCTSMETSPDECKIDAPLEKIEFLDLSSEDWIAKLNDKIIENDTSEVRIILKSQKVTPSDCQSVERTRHPMYMALKTLDPEIFKALLDAGFDPDMTAYFMPPLKWLTMRCKLSRFDECGSGYFEHVNTEEVKLCIRHFLNRNTNWLDITGTHALIFESAFKELLKSSWDDHPDLREAILKELERQGYSFKNPLLNQITFDLATSREYSCEVLRWAFEHGASTEASGVINGVNSQAKQLRLLIRYVYWQIGPLDSEIKSMKICFKHGSRDRASLKALTLLEAGADCLEVTDIDPIPPLVIILMEPNRPLYGSYGEPVASFTDLRKKALDQLTKREIDLNSAQVCGKMLLDYIAENEWKISKETFLLLLLHGLRPDQRFRRDPLYELKLRLCCKPEKNLQLACLHETLWDKLARETLFSLPCYKRLIRRCIYYLIPEITSE